MLANLPGVSYESAPKRFWETRSTILDWEDFLTELLRCAVPYRTGPSNIRRNGSRSLSRPIARVS